MKALKFLGERKIDVIEIPTPEIKNDEVLLEIQAAGLCGSDLHLFYRPSNAEKEAGIFGLKFPVENIPGHEPAGRVVRVGSHVSHLKVGDRVAVAHISGCGHCMICRQGWDMHCVQKRTYGGDMQGAYGEFMPARAKDCVILPENISYTDGAFYTCGASTGYYAMQRANLKGGETVVCVGLGPVGLAGAIFAKKLGATVIGVDLTNERCDFAKKHGVDYTINASTEDVEKRVLEITHGKGAQVSVDFTGDPRGRITAIKTAGLWGRVVFIGFGEGMTTIDAEIDVIEKQLTITGAWVFSFPELQNLVEYASINQIDLSNLTNSKTTIDKGPEIFSSFDQGSIGKSFIVPTN